MYIVRRVFVSRKPQVLKPTLQFKKEKISWRHKKNSFGHLPGDKGEDMKISVINQENSVTALATVLFGRRRLPLFFWASFDS